MQASATGHLQKQFAAAAADAKDAMSTNLPESPQQSSQQLKASAFYDGEGGSNKQSARTARERNDTKRIHDLCDAAVKDVWAIYEGHAKQ